MLKVNRKDLTAGLLFLAIAAFFAITALRNLETGTAFRMGPGFFPLLLAGLLSLMAVGILIRAFATAETPFGGWSWRGVILVLAAPVCFGLIIKGAGLMATIFCVSFLTSMASARVTWLMAAGMSLAISLFCTVVFVWALGLPIPMFGPWLGGY